MAGVNKVILLGNLGKDPEVRHLENGRAVANFSIATSETYKNKQGEKVTNTEWHNVVLWTPLAEIAEKYLNKGNQVYIEGKLTSRSYEDKDGVTKYITEVVGREMTLLGGPSRPEGASPAADNSTSNNQASSDPAPVEESNEIDDLPF
ncbi:single-strand binding protein [Reichenbachiella faecimaris]|uniref:Single-stranded DNA-binding protein n=1 Tax=Reichenbachiella faecimaris TaxID=692418 RepID=A0A1W2GF96_REIFA|nr:single-stranded DNA-binding protein [Reichenbachiella faecimaris]SMD35162.1 single-strand binding protein [Reichenbachiella faecimaris]